MLDGGDDVARRQVEADQPGGVEPDAHGVVERAEQRGRADAGDAAEAVEHVDGDVVGDEQRRLLGALAAEGEEFQDRRGALLHRHTLALHLLRQAREGGLDAVVDVDGVDVRVGAELERDGQPVAAVVARVGLHVDHSIGAIKNHLERLGDGGLDHGGRCAGVAGGDLNLRGYDVGELRDRDAQHGERAGERHDDRDDDRQARAVDEDGGDHVRSSAWG